jgi:hypothetical protein
LAIDVPWSSRRQAKWVAVEQAIMLDLQVENQGTIGNGRCVKLDRLKPIFHDTLKAMRK